MVKEERNFRLLNQMLRNATKEELPNAFSPVSPHHQKVDGVFRNIGFDLSIWMPTSRDKIGLNPVALEKITQICE